jgi:hypothetical protein
VPPDAPDAIVLVHGAHDWAAIPATRPLFVCAEMFLDLVELESRRLRLWRLREQLRGQGLSVATLAEFLEPEDIAWIESTAAFIAHHWYRDGALDRTLYRGVSLGSCCEYDLKAKAIRVLKFAITCRRMRARHPNCPVYSDYSADSIEAKLLVAVGIDARLLNVPSALDTSATEPVTTLNASVRARLQATLNRRGRESGLRVARLISAVAGPRGQRGLPSVVVRPSQQTVAMLQRWTERAPRRLHMAIWMSHLIFPRHLVRLLRAGATLVAPPPARAPEHAAELEAVVNGWVGWTGTTLDVDTRTGFLLRGVFADLFERAVRLEFPTHAGSIDHAYAVLQKPPAAGLVLPNDCQGIMRAWTLVAKRTGTRTLIVQHGHLDYTEDGDHFTGDYSAFWSSMVCEQYEALGLEPDRMLVTGSPNADVSSSAPMESLRVPRGSKPRVLVITTGNPGVQAYIDETWVTDFIVRVLSDLCDGQGRFDVSVRLHPGESLELYRQHVRPWLHQLGAIGDSGSLGEWLARADVVISPPSTVVLEARARGIPVVLLPIPSVDGRRTNLRDLDGVLALEEHESVMEGVLRVVRGDATASGARVRLEAHLGPRDGNAGLRLLEAVETIALARSPRPALVER